MAQVWSIMINGDVPAQFNPDVYNTKPGDPLKAQLGDLVSWNNQTKEPHQIQVGSTFTTNQIEAAKSSTPGYHILGHEDRGMMTVVEVTPGTPPKQSPYAHH